MGYYDVTLRGVTFDGSNEAGSPLKIVGGGVDGLGSVLVRTARLEQVFGAGSYGGRDRQRARTLRIPLAIQADETYTLWEQLDRVKAAFGPGTTDIPLTLCLPGIPTDDETLTYFGRAEGIVDDGLETFAGDLIRCFGIFTATDPYGYGPEEEIEFDPTEEHSFDNIGTAAHSRWTFEIPTGVTGPRLYNDLVAGESVDLDGYAVATNPVILNGRPHTILQNGVSIYTAKSGSGEWLNIRKGTNTWGFTVDSGAGTATLAWRSAWL